MRDFFKTKIPIYNSEVLEKSPQGKKNNSSQETEQKLQSFQAM